MDGVRFDIPNYLQYGSEYTICSNVQLETSCIFLSESHHPPNNVLFYSFLR